MEHESSLKQCPMCGYSLEGLPSEHKCPECGEAYDTDVRVWQPHLDLSLKYAPYWIPILLLLLLLPQAVIGSPMTFNPIQAITMLIGVLTIGALGGLIIRWANTTRLGPLLALMPRGVFIRYRGRESFVAWKDIRSVELVFGSGLWIHRHGALPVTLRRGFRKRTLLEIRDTIQSQLAMRQTGPNANTLNA